MLKVPHDPSESTIFVSVQLSRVVLLLECILGGSLKVDVGSARPLANQGWVLGAAGLRCEVARSRDMLLRRHGIILIGENLVLMDVIYDSWVLRI